MPETDYLKIPQNRIGALIGNKGDVKKSIEKATETILDIDSEDGTVYITPQENMIFSLHYLYMLSKVYNILLFILEFLTSKQNIALL